MLTTLTVAYEQVSVIIVRLLILLELNLEKEEVLTMGTTTFCKRKKEPAVVGCVEKIMTRIMFFCNFFSFNKQ